MVRGPFAWAARLLGGTSLGAGLLGAALLGAPPAQATERHPSVELGVGLGLLTGGNGSGYGVGPSQRLGLGVPAGRIHSVAIGVEHAHHALLRAGAYLPGTTVDDDAINGFRDRWNLSLGGRFQLELADPSADRLVVEPLGELGMSFIASRSEVTMAGMRGQATLGAWSFAPAIDIGAGADVRVRRFLALVPAFRVAVSLAENAPESGGEAVFGAEVRGDLSVSARLTW